MSLKSTLVFQLLLFAFLANSVASNPTQPTASNPKEHAMLGSWELREIHWISPDQTRSVVPSQPGVLIVDPKRYAIMWTSTPTPRVPFKILASPTDEEMKAGFSSIAFNAGSYELTESTLTTTAQIAKVPGFEGGKQYFRYKIENGILTLSMFDEIYPDGKKPAWSGKLEVKFILKKVQ
jgi:Lipocalin-like domain